MHAITNKKGRTVRRSGPAVSEVGQPNFGLAPVGDKDWQLRISAVTAVRDILARDVMPGWSLDDARVLGTLKKLLGVVISADTPDWVSVSRLIGHPSPGQCAIVADQLDRLFRSIIVGDPTGYAAARLTCLDGTVPTLIERYLTLTVEGGHPPREDGWAFVLRSESDLPNVVAIGAARGGIESIVRAVDRENRWRRPSRVIGAWIVRHPELVGDDMRTAFETVETAPGKYRLPPAEARADVEALLVSNATLMGPRRFEFVRPVLEAGLAA